MSSIENPNALRNTLDNTSDDALTTIEETLEKTSKTYRANKNILSYKSKSGINVYADTCPVCGKGYIITEEEEDEDTEETILATQITTTPERRFISDSDLEELDEISKTYMNINNYTGSNGFDKVNKAKEADVALSIEWENVSNRPNLDYTNVNDLINNSHSHSNKSALDKLSFDSDTNEPLWNNEEWPYPVTVNYHDLSGQYIRNIIINNKDVKVNNENLYIGDIYFKVDYNTDDIVNINIKYDRNKYYTLSVENIMLNILDQVESPIRRIVDESVIVNHEELYHLQGGDSGEYYHLTEDEYNTLQNIIREYKNRNNG